MDQMHIVDVEDGWLEARKESTYIIYTSHGIR